MTSHNAIAGRPGDTEPMQGCGIKGRTCIGPVSNHQDNDPTDGIAFLDKPREVTKSGQRSKFPDGDYVCDLLPVGLFVGGVGH